MQKEVRTVSKVGGSSLMVTLPKGWLRYMGIKAGDTVEVITNGEVIIRPIVGHDNGKANNKNNPQSRD